MIGLREQIEFVKNQNNDRVVNHNLEIKQFDPNNRAHSKMLLEIFATNYVRMHKRNGDFTQKKSQCRARLQWLRALLSNAVKYAHLVLIFGWCKWLYTHTGIYLLKKKLPYRTLDSEKYPKAYSIQNLRMKIYVLWFARKLRRYQGLDYDVL